MTTHTPSRQTTRPPAVVTLLVDWQYALKGLPMPTDWNEPTNTGLSNRAMTTLAIVGWVAFIAWGIGIWG